MFHAKVGQGFPLRLSGDLVGELSYRKAVTGCNRSSENRNGLATKAAIVLVSAMGTAPTSALQEVRRGPFEQGWTAPTSLYP